MDVFVRQHPPNRRQVSIFVEIRIEIEFEN